MVIDLSRMTERDKYLYLSKEGQARRPKPEDKTGLALPKKRKPAGRVAECPEKLLQAWADEYLETIKIWHIRFSSWLMASIKEESKHNPLHPAVKAEFFRQVAGKFSDNLICLPVGPGMFLMTKMELKTRDKKGRPVGKTHGKQTHYANVEGWPIARSPEEIQAVVETAKENAEKIKKLLAFDVEHNV